MREDEIEQRRRSSLAEKLKDSVHTGDQQAFNLSLCEIVVSQQGKKYVNFAKFEPVKKDE